MAKTAFRPPLSGLKKIQLVKHLSAFSRTLLLYGICREKSSCFYTSFTKFNAPGDTFSPKEKAAA